MCRAYRVLDCDCHASSRERERERQYLPMANPDADPFGMKYNLNYVL